MLKIKEKRSRGCSKCIYKQYRRDSKVVFPNIFNHQENFKRQKLYQEFLDLNFFIWSLNFYRSKYKEKTSSTI